MCIYENKVFFDDSVQFDNIQFDNIQLNELHRPFSLTIWCLTLVMYSRHVLLTNGGSVQSFLVSDHGTSVYRLICFFGLATCRL